MDYKLFIDETDVFLDRVMALADVLSNADVLESTTVELMTWNLQTLCKDMRKELDCVAEAYRLEVVRASNKAEQVAKVAEAIGVTDYGTPIKQIMPVVQTLAKNWNDNEGLLRDLKTAVEVMEYDKAQHAASEAA